MKLFIIFVTIFIVGICAESNIGVSSDGHESAENLLTILAKSSWSRACVSVNGKWECQESTNNGDGHPTKTRTFSGLDNSNGSPFKGLFGNSPFDWLDGISPLFGNNNGRKSSHTSNTQSGRNPQRTQITPDTSQGSGTAPETKSKFKIVRQNSQTAPNDDDDILI